MLKVLKSILYRANSSLIFSPQLALSTLFPPPNFELGVALLANEESSDVNASKVSSVIALSRLLNAATWCRTFTALSSLPLYNKNFGDSWNRKTTNRRMKTKSAMQPRTINVYRQPMLLAFVQHGCPLATLLQAGSGFPSAPSPHAYLGIKP